MSSVIKTKRISKRRQQIIDSYGLPKRGRPKKKRIPDSSDLPIYSPIRMQREFQSEGINRHEAKLEAKRKHQEKLNNKALKNKKRLTMAEADEAKRLAAKRLSDQVNRLQSQGILTAAGAKRLTTDKSSIAMETSAPYYNFQDNYIDVQYDGKTSAYDPRHCDLIEIHDDGKMIWHGDTCAICTMPPSTVGEVMLAQYGEASFVCIDCGKLVETKGLGVRGWIFAQIQKLKRHKVTQLKPFMIPKEDEDDKKSNQRSV